MSASDGLVQLSDIPTITQLYQRKALVPSSEPRSGSTSKYNGKIALIKNDITKLKVAVIVNAANRSLLGGGGVDGAIHRAAGPELVEECENLDGCPTGDAKITDAYRLPCNKVIHAVGPVYSTEKRKGTHKQLLQSCYTRSLDLMSENGCSSVAFSSISTGVYGYPSVEAADDAVSAVKGWLDGDAQRSEKVDRIIFCVFPEKDQKAYEETLPKYFTPE